MAEIYFKYNGNEFSGKIYILNKNFDSILGRDLIRKLHINFSELYQVDEIMTKPKFEEEVNKLIFNYENIFNSEIWKIPNYKYNIKLKNENITPIFIRPRPVPYALQKRIEDEIDRLERLDIIEKVIHSPWGTPVVPVVKSNGDLRLCADYKATLNKFILDDNYPIPRIEDLFVKLSGGKHFCTLDISQAYLHMEVDEESQIMQAISTHNGVWTKFYMICRSSHAFSMILSYEE